MVQDMDFAHHTEMDGNRERAKKKYCSFFFFFFTSK